MFFTGQPTRIKRSFSTLLNVSPLLRRIGFGITASFYLALTGCATTTPSNPENLCEIYREKKGWHEDSLAMEKRWNVPVHVPMAMMYQESMFRHDARPPKKYLIGIIPWGRISSAYGYSQALDGTWAEYKQSTGRRFASRSNYGDAIDFMGWYINRTKSINGVSVTNARTQYLNYHEGWTGYRKRTYNKKAWLVGVAKKVGNRSSVYRSQYKSCKESLSRGFWMSIFS